MSNVSGITTIKYVRQGDTLSCGLRSTFPLKQFVTGGNGIVSPSFAANKPCVYPVIRSSLTATRISPLTEGVSWYYNGTKITFGTDGLSAAMGDLAAGTFKSETKSVDGVTVPTLTILKDIASSSNIDPDTILFQATVNTGFKTGVSASIEIAIEQTNGEAFLPYITVNNGGIIDDQVSSLTAKAHLLIGGTEKTDGVSYEWFKMKVTDGLDGWISTGAKAQTLTIAESDISSSELYKCVITYGDKTAEAVLEVSDETDVLIIYPNPTDGSGNTVPEELSESQPSIVYAPEIRKRSDQSVQSGFTKYYLLTNSSGDTISSQDGGDTFTVTLDNAKTAGGDLTLIITASKS